MQSEIERVWLRVPLSQLQCGSAKMLANPLASWRFISSCVAAMHKILIVDDEEPARYGIRRAIEASGRQIIEAADAAEARAALAAHRPHLMLVDINMPGEDG